MGMRRTDSPDFMARLAMKRSVTAGHPGDRRRPRHPPDPGQLVGAAAARWRQRAVHQRQEFHGKGREPDLGNGTVPAARAAADHGQDRCP